MTDQTTSYGEYQQPWQGGPAKATGKELLRASWGLLRQDRELLWLPVLAMFSSLFAAVVLFMPGFALGWALGGKNGSVGGWVGGLFAVFAASAVSIYFQAALVIGANERADGGNPTLGGVLAQAWALRVRILSWAALTTTVGTVIRAVEQRLGILGRVIGFLGGIAWAIASFLVVPVLVAENLGPVAAVKRSAQLIRDTWGTGLRTTLRFGLIQFVFLVPAFAAVVVGLAVLASGSAVGIAIGGLLVLVGFVSLFAISLVASAVASYARALIYRYATGRAVPGVDPQLFAGAFQPKKRSRRFA